MDEELKKELLILIRDAQRLVHAVTFVVETQHSSSADVKEIIRLGLEVKMAQEAKERGEEPPSDLLTHRGPGQSAVVQAVSK